MVGVAQLVEPWIVIPVVVGSSPIVHPSYPGKPLVAHPSRDGIILNPRWVLCSNTAPHRAVSSIGRAADS
jgi:hypothetical protein